MIISSKTAEEKAIMKTAYAMCAAARTAPKTHAMDHLETAIITGAEKEALTAEMRRLSEVFNYAFFARDAGNVDKSLAVVLIGVREGQRGLNEGCAFCHHKNCKECADNSGCCAYDPMDLGIALGSAVSVAADNRIDSRIMFSVGRAAASLSMLGEDIRQIIGIPLSVSGKSPFFDRKK